MKTNVRMVTIALVGLLVISIVGCNRDAGDGIDIPDAGLREAIANDLGIQDDTSITADDMLKLTEFRFFTGDGPIIVNLTGLEYATNLKKLSIIDNWIVDVSPLKGLTNLEVLDLEVNGVVDVSPLKGLTKLERLNLYGNRIVDVSPLKGLTKLESLNLYGNRIVDVSPLKGLTKLGLLWLSDNPLSQDSINIHIPAIEANGTIVVW